MYITNKFRNLPIFAQLNFYYNDENREIKREIEIDKSENNLAIIEKIFDKTRSSESIVRHEYKRDREEKTFLFFIAKPLVIAIVFFFIFCNLMLQFYDVIKIEKAITLITFIFCIGLLLSSLLSLLYLLSIPYRTKEPSLKLIMYFSYLQYIGYFVMVLLFVYFTFISPTVKNTYIYSCVMHLTILSFYTYAIYKYMLLPLKMIIEQDMTMFRSVKDNKIILIDIKE